MKQQLFDFELVPWDWALCFRSECPFRSKCQRWLAGQYAPETVELRTCVTPHAVSREVPCRFYVKAEPIMMACGFDDLFREVRRADYPALRAEVYRFLGSERLYYYYKNGEKLLTPEQQDGLEAIFRAHGYEGCITYHSREPRYVFPHARQ